MKFIAGLSVALAISTVSAMAQAPPPPRPQTGTEAITIVGCLREWKPATDVTRLPENKQLGTYLLTPIATSSSVMFDVPTYLLTPSLVVNFEAHLDDKVEVIGVTQPASRGRTIGAIIGAPTPRPEEQSDVQSMPRLTIRSLKKISDACPS